jgi:hypothetical protein
MSDEAKVRRVKVRCLPVQGTTWEELDEQVRKITNWAVDARVHRYVESVSSCSLTVGVVEPPAADAWEGRWFDERFDVRWVHDLRKGGGWKAWVTWEADGDATDAVCVKQRYYLLGEWNADLGTNPEGEPFTEGRHPGKVFRYPIPQSSTCKQHDRAFISVIEYRLTEPDWTKEAPAGDLDAVEEALGRERLFAHRFVDLGVGRD